MARLKIMGSSGHETKEWDPAALGTNDPEAVAILREAENICNAHIAKGLPVFAVDPRTQATRTLERFDPQAEEIVVALPLAGG